ncbi:MAG: Light-independent protochlorophyllide reductase subunit B [Nitrospirae bacterium]|nr:MAG: radical SAM protein [Nitrospira sp. OLB3]MBV6470019.1 Light-independent protochlorophyllide reductase subunit B [Nitrospirota bacterium]MCK6501480.1 PCP reductase family protein [Nitrospira sp.]QOJ35103.1 MAG: PCP reductase family protein [Nitrospira sp.]
MVPDVRWSDGALKRMERAPIFLRGMVRRLAEKKARELGYGEITEEILEQFKGQMMGNMGGESGMAAAADQMAKGQLPWTAAAKERLEAVPEFMRGMIRQIAEEIAREGGHMEVNVDLFDRVEAMGEVRERQLPSLEWTEGALALLQEKIKASPPIAMEFVGDMIKCDTEEAAREQGLSRIDEVTVQQLWAAPQERIPWSDEAWKRLQTSPDFVRSGIRKAAERRARKLGLAEVDSEHLTTFRNQAMMKAVKRIRSFGYKDLTFDAFDTAMEKTKRLQGNAQAEKRLQEIRSHFSDPNTKKPEGGTLGAELMGRFRKFLKGEETL